MQEAKQSSVVAQLNFALFSARFASLTHVSDAGSVAQKAKAKRSFEPAKGPSLCGGQGTWSP